MFGAETFFGQAATSWCGCRGALEGAEFGFVLEELWQLAEEKFEELLGRHRGDVDWDASRMTVRSPKTEHHEGKECRVMPIFPELRPYLQAVYDEFLEDFDPKSARLSEQPVITRYRNRNSNLRTQLNRIIAKAGLEPWPKLFHNLRSTRQTELAEKFPAHVVCEWIGNSEAVAAKHYLQTTAEHFDKAVADPTGGAA